MDTIGFSLFQPEIERFVDGWLAKNATIHEKQRSKAKDFDRRKPYAWLRDYKTVKAYRFEGKDVFLGYDKNHDVATLGVLRFQVHLSQFLTLQEFLVWSEKIFREAQPCLIDAKIFRLDLQVDVVSPLDFFYRHLVQPRAKNQRVTRHGRRTLEIGAYPQSTHVYEWDCPHQLVDLVLEDRNPNDSGNIRVTRIEARRWGKKVPIRSLREVERLKAIDPFHHLRLIGDLIHIPDNLPTATRNMLMAFQGLSKEFGAQEARKQLNQQRNLSRTVEKYLQPVPQNLLQKAWKRHVRRFLGNQPILFPSPLKSVSFIDESVTGVRMRRTSTGTKVTLLDPAFEQGDR